MSVSCGPGDDDDDGIILPIEWSFIYGKLIYKKTPWPTLTYRTTSFHLPSLFLWMEEDVSVPRTRRGVNLGRHGIYTFLPGNPLCLWF